MDCATGGQRSGLARQGLEWRPRGSGTAAERVREEKRIRGGGSGQRKTAERRRHKEEKKRRNRPRLRTKPAPEQRDHDKRSALEAVALLGQGNGTEEAGDGDSGHRTYPTDSDAHQSDEALRVTLRSADNL
ncbi:hypothetical protein NDU88_005719 [Pleurodeles waltl]|uniref:Uncharacterized protein n=1 Tax=Pleurodeles waltl TaxID=8319 RepID=A0AAV7WCQ3_PLEWA|nr:hypothetical protein NDU88_005719 [Pleurodeles waltl]